jgi:predicted dehydrogenase
MLKVAIVGCGKIADEHARQIGRVPGCRLVAFYDAEPLMAMQMQERYEGTAYFDDLDALLSQAKPDVVHITTPPQSHFSVALRCLEAGCHVFVEKPFTMNCDEAIRLIAAAENRSLKICVDHNLQFTGPALRMRELINQGFLGGPVVHVESHYCYNMGDSNYAKAFLSDSGHWLRSLPGGLLQNIISHGIGRVAQHLSSDAPTVRAYGFTSDLLRGLGETKLIDELRVVIKGDSTTAYFTFSSQMHPQISHLRVFGARNGLFIDDDYRVLLKLKGARHKSYLQQILPALDLSKQFLANAVANARELVTGRLHMSEGMKSLIEAFYRSITDGEPAPIPYREIVLTARIMDDVFDQIGQSGRQAETVLRAHQSVLN